MDSLFRAKTSFKSIDLTQTKIYWRVVENSKHEHKLHLLVSYWFGSFSFNNFPVFFYFLRNTNSCSICHICLIESRNLKIVRRIYRKTCEFRLRAKGEPSACFLPLWKIIFQQDRKEVVSLLTCFLYLWKNIFQWEKKTSGEAH